MTFTDTVRQLEAALAGPLPGAAAQAALAPRPRREWPAGFSRVRLRHAAGLVLLFPIDDRPYVVLTVRGETLRHGGQVSLPGGVVEAGETFEQTALREAREEVDLDPEGVRVLGALTPVDIPVSGFRLHPIVATSARRPVLRPADGEVARILEVALDDLFDPARFVEADHEREGRRIRVPAIRLGDTELWGATGMAMAELMALLGWQAPRLRI